LPERSAFKEAEIHGLEQGIYLMPQLRQRLANHDEPRSVPTIIHGREKIAVVWLRRGLGCAVNVEGVADAVPFVVSYH